MKFSVLEEQLLMTTVVLCSGCRMLTEGPSYIIYANLAGRDQPSWQLEIAEEEAVLWAF